MDTGLSRTAGFHFMKRDSLRGVTGRKTRSLFARGALTGQSCQELLPPFRGLVTNGLVALGTAMSLQMDDGDLAPEPGYLGAPVWVFMPPPLGNGDSFLEPSQPLWPPFHSVHRSEPSTVAPSKPSR